MGTLVASADGGDDWQRFFAQLTMPGLANGEHCKFSQEKQEAYRRRTGARSICRLRRDETRGSPALVARLSLTARTDARGEFRSSGLTNSLCLAAPTYYIVTAAGCPSPVRVGTRRAGMRSRDRSLLCSKYQRRWRRRRDRLDAAESRFFQPCTVLAHRENVRAGRRANQHVEPE